MATEEYRVRIDSFEGPLDLLLFLIHRAEVDVADIPIARITEQYLAFVAGGEDVDIDAAGEFLVMAAALIEIKSQMVNPRPRGGAVIEAKPEPGEDPRAELVRTLLAYRRFRSLGEALSERRRLWLERAPARAGVDHAAVRAAMEADRQGGFVELDDVDVMLLVEAYRRISEAVDFNRLGTHSVIDDDTPLELHARDVLDQIRRRGDGASSAPLPLAEVFTGRSRSEMIGLFLAVLELVRQRNVRIRQADGGIVLEPGENPEPSSPAAPA